MWDNLLPADEQSFTEGQGTWVGFPDVAGVQRSSEQFITAPASLRIQNTLYSSASTVFALTGANVLPESLDTDSTFEVFFSIYSTTSRSASVSAIWHTDETGISGTVTTTTFSSVTRSNSWSLFKFETEAPANSRSVRLSVMIAGVTSASSTAESHYIDECHIIRKGVGRNRFLALTAENLPEFIKDSDAEQSNPDYPLRRFLDAATTQANDVLTDVVGFWYQPIEEGGTTTTASSSLVNPSLANSEWLPWLAQLLSARRPPELNTGFTPWFLLDDGGDRPWETSGTPISWSNYITGSDAGSMTWDGIEDKDPSPFDTEQLFREFLLTGASGLKAGTTAGIKAAVKAMMRLTSGYSLADTFEPTIEVERHVGGNIWNLKIKTAASATADSSLLLLAADLVKPAGASVTYAAL